MIGLALLAKRSSLCVGLFEMDLRYEQDVVVARQRARQIAQTAGIESRRLASLTTACSEVIRNAWKRTAGGRVEVWVYLDPVQPVWMLRVAEQGVGNCSHPTPTLDISSAATPANAEKTELEVASELAEYFDLRSYPDRGIEVLIGFDMPPGIPLKTAHWHQLAERFRTVEPQSAYDAVRSDQQELLRLTEQLQHREDELRRVNAELEATNKGVLALYAELEAKADELERANCELQVEIQERRRAESERERLHQQLVESSRLAGMAEVASGVLHNIGNTLNSLNVSAQVLQQCIHDSALTGLSKVVDLLDANAHRLGEFLTQDPQGTRVLPYLRALARRYQAEREEALAEVETLTQSVYHITRIVAAQQSHARVAGVTEQIAVDDLLEDALLMHAERARSSGIEIVIRTDAIDVIRTDRHKALQVLVNLIGNAIDAVEAHDSPVRRVTLVTRTEGDQACFEIQDTGIGIPTELLTKIFQHGFTTKPHGHGFGLHSCALTAKELGGTLTVSSDGVGKGAQFTLRLPLFSEGDETCSTIRKTVCAS